MEQGSLRESFTDAIRFWESYRFGYNIVLALIVAAYFVAGYPGSKEAISLNFTLELVLLAVLANVAYCTAYLPDIWVQRSGFRRIRERARCALFVLGTASAAVVTRFVATGLFRFRD